MCFSAQASFIASALLLTTWVVSLLKASKPSHFLLTFVPFFFGVQQFVEGMLWILIPKGGPSWAITAATYLFLSIASFVWPLLIPLAGRALEAASQRKNVLTVFIIAALAWTLIGGYQLFTYGATATIADAHILYKLHSPLLPTWISAYYYCSAVLLPFFIASNRLFNLLGVLTTLSCIAAYFFWYVYFVSVWCFFAAVISIGTSSVIFSLAKEEQRKLK